MKHEEVKQYVIDTIKTGNKKRIQKVIKRYYKYLKEKEEEKQEDLVNAAKRIFS